MRIVVDLQGAQGASAHRGIGRYSLSLTQALARGCDGHELFVALNGMFPESIEPIRAALDGILDQSRIRVWEAVGPVSALGSGNTGRIRRGECVREAFLERLEPDVVLVSSVFEGLNDDALTSIGTFAHGIPMAAILYDLIPYIHRKPYLEDPAVERWYFEKIEHLKRADCLLAISESARQEAIESLSFAAERVVTISAAADEFFGVLAISGVEEARLRTQYALPRPFVMSVGGYDYRKNIEGLIRAYALLPEPVRRSHQLAVVGSILPVHRAGLDDLVGRLGLKSGEVVFTGYAPDTDLRALYNLCELVVLPSWHEGFGLPAIEAMRCGAAVIGANASSLPEVIGRRDALFDPYSDQAIADAIARGITDDAYRAELKNHGIEREQNYSWSQCARRAIQALERAARPHPAAAPGAERLHERLVGRLASIDDESSSDREWLDLATAIDRSFASPGRVPQLFVDVSELSQRDARSGIQRVVRSILRELLSNPPNEYRIEPVHANVQRPGYRYAREFTNRFLGRTGPIAEDDPIETAPGDLILGLDLQSDVIRAQAEYLRGLRRSGVRVHFVVYDLIPVLHPGAFPAGAEQGHSAWLATIGEFDGAICISRSVANELESWLRVNGPSRLRPFAIRSFRLGADFEPSSRPENTPREIDGDTRAAVTGTSFLMVGTVEPRKRHAQALDAFEALWADGVHANLVIAGKQGWMVDALAQRLRENPERGTRLFWFEDASDETLNRLYRSATCLLAASAAEGFGLPLVEAARHGLPILARDIPVFREIAGDSAVYFSGDQPADLANAVQSWLELHRQGRTPQPAGIRIHTWRESAVSLMDALQTGIAPEIEPERNAIDGIGHRLREPHLIQIAKD